MEKKYIINDMVVYHPEQHRLTPLGNRGKETALNIPASRCLLLMLQRPGVTINQDEFFNEVWEKNRQYVTPNTFYQNICLIRKGIRNAGIRSQVIKTIPKVGVCFTGTVQTIDEEDDERDNSIIQTENLSYEKLYTIKDIESSEDVAKIEETKNEKSSATKKSNIFTKRFTSANIINVSLLIFTGLILLTTVQSKSERFFSTHIKIADVNQCSVYVNLDDLTGNYGHYVNFLTARDVVCGPNEFIHIANKSSKEDTLVLFCKNLDTGDLQCSTRFKLAGFGVRPLN